MPLTGVNSVTVRPDRMRAFEEAIGQLAKKAVDKKERWQWRAHQTRIGEVARLHFVYEAESFAAIEGLGTVDELYRRVLGSKQGEELFLQVNECIERIQHTVSTERPDLSYPLYEFLDSLVPLREQILEGDLRVLYLAWLKANEFADQDDEDSLEPPVPPNLQKL